ncbi:hypothetical protein [Demequina sp.]|uniref:hypothetical protein n=1 Tax=Demequina sp. TaxID=2050685 RepID=UPI003D129B30
MGKAEKERQRAEAELHAAQVDALRSRLSTNPDDDSPLAQARRMMSDAVPELIAKPKSAPAPRRHTTVAVTTMFSIGTLAALGFSYMAMNAKDQASPTNTPSPQVTVWMHSYPEAEGAAAITPPVQPSATPSPTATTEKPAKGTSSGGTKGTTSSGGSKTGGSTSSGGSTTTTKPKPKPKPTKTSEPAAAYADRMTWTGTSGAGYIDISANVHTTGSVKVTVTATGPNGTITLDTKTVDGWDTFTGRMDGLDSGTYTITVSAGGGLSTSKQVPVF